MTKNKPLFQFIYGSLRGKKILFYYTQNKNIKIFRRELCNLIIDNEMQNIVERNNLFK